MTPFIAGCKYGCICHLCGSKTSGESDQESPKEEAKPKVTKKKQCTKEYCRLGCICASLSRARKKCGCISKCMCRKHNIRDGKGRFIPKNVVEQLDSNSTSDSEIPRIVLKPNLKPQKLVSTTLSKPLRHFEISPTLESILEEVRCKKPECQPVCHCLHEFKIPSSKVSKRKQDISGK